MRHEVPQFIDIKDKIFGPLTFNQFVYVAGGLGLGYLVLRFVPSFVRYIIALPLVLFAFALAFYQVNKRPFIYTVEAFITYLTKSKLYLWQFKKDKTQSQPSTTPVPKKPASPQSSSSKPLDSELIRDLTSSLDILDK